jgi:hypothetical protein
MAKMSPKPKTEDVSFPTMAVLALSYQSHYIFVIRHSP